MPTSTVDQLGSDEFGDVAAEMGRANDDKKDRERGFRSRSDGLVRVVGA